MSEDKFGITLVDRDRVWAEVQSALIRQKNEDILTVMFDDDGDAPSVAKIKKILDILKRYDELVHDWDLKLHNGKTAKEEAEERSEQIRKTFGSLEDFDSMFRDIFGFSGK
jgi:hypothetical protein